MRVAVIDAESSFATVLAKRLEAAGWQMRLFGGPVPVEELIAAKVHAVLVDPAAVGEDFWEFLELACAVGALGVIVCAAPTTVAERVRGLRLGADDWLAKPCHPDEVAARLEAATRRHRKAAAPSVGPRVIGEVEIRPDQFQAFVSGRSMDLTRREFELLHRLAEAQGQVVGRDEIYQRVWGYAMAHGDRSVDVFVRRLRQKLERFSPGWTYIHTHFGVGYRLDPEQPDAGPVPGPSQTFHSSETPG